MPPASAPESRTPATQAIRRSVTTVRLGGDALPLWWKILANLIVVILGLAALSILLSLPAHGWEVESQLLREALWDGQPHAPAVAVLLAVAAFALIPLVVRFPRGWAHREVRIDSTGMEFVKHRRWWFRGRSGRVDWAEVQLISAWQVPHWEPRLGRDSQRVLTPVLDIYLHQRELYLPDWVGVRTVRRWLPEGVDAPATRLRVGGPSKAAQQSLRALAVALGRARPELFYRGMAIDQWYTPPTNRTIPLPVALAEGSDTETVPLRRGEPPRPVWLCHTMPWTRWALGVCLFVAVLALAVAVVLHPTDASWPTAVAALVALGLLPALVSWVAFAPWKLAQQGVGVDEDGIYVLRIPLWWAGRRVWFVASWEQVQAAVARQVPAPAGRGRTRRVVDLYLHAAVPERLGHRITVTQHSRPDGPQMGSRVAFPATRLRLDYSRLRERWTLRWGRGWRGTPQVRRFSRHQLRPTLYTFRPELCSGFDDLLADLEPGTRWVNRWFGLSESLVPRSEADRAAGRDNGNG
ncbi:hypothetical protein RIF23_09740 [Lipingzhangella sp. LS1_29]|uniref:Uncharacterized protein n=1 Tax=Lipingzhangella rawalii TaxID=2055835 RepID=A0ABU2H5K3_9ACTN|nr:hypothetical protein [Lipingzhangella rawalii]MDS1270578.1 hypothetical protein [Lipingzhangella rawalii]